MLTSEVYDLKVRIQLIFCFMTLDLAKDIIESIFKLLKELPSFILFTVYKITTDSPSLTCSAADDTSSKPVTFNPVNGDSWLFVESIRASFTRNLQKIIKSFLRCCQKD